MKKEIFRVPDSLQFSDFASGRGEKVAVFGAGCGVGVSYVCSKILQGDISGINKPCGSISLAELGKPHFYVALDMEKRFLGRDFHFYEDGLIGSNMELGIDWQLRKPGFSASEPVFGMNSMRVLSRNAADFTLYDCSSVMDPDVLKCIAQSVDRLYLVVDPFPTKLIESADFLDWASEELPPFEIIVNKYCRGIHKAQLSGFLGRSDYYCCEAADISALLKAEYNCVLA